MGAHVAGFDRGRDSGPAVERAGRALKERGWKDPQIPSVDRAVNRAYASSDQSARHGPGIQGLRGRAGSTSLVCFENAGGRFRGARSDCRSGAGKCLDEVQRVWYYLSGTGDVQRTRTAN